LPDYHICRRKSFKDIAEALCKSSCVPGEECVTVTLVGGGGFGKTTMALCVCHHRDVKDAFPSGIVFIELGPEPCDPSKILNEHYCRMTCQDFEYVNDVEEEIQKATKKRKILVVIDDVWLVEDAKPIVKAFCHCKIMLTTRIPKIGIKSRNIFEIDCMSLKESVSLMTNGILEYNELSKEDAIVVNKLAQSTHQWPLLLSLIRGQLYHCLSHGNATIKEAILDVRSNLATKGLSAFDVAATPKVRQHSVRACIEASLGLLGKLPDPEFLKYKLLSLILYTGIGGSLPSQAIQCLWDVSDEAAKTIVLSLEQYGLVYIKSSKQLPPYFNTAHHFLAVHSVISEYIMSTIKSETVVRLSPFISLNTDKLIATVEQLLFQQSYEVDPSRKLEFLTHNKQKMEHIVLPYYMKDINMHALHDPHLAIMILHNIQSLLNDERHFHLLVLFNEQIISLINECHDALTKAQDLSRKVNLHFQLCFRRASFDNLLPVMKEYLKSHFIASTIVKCEELAKSISEQCDADLKTAVDKRRKHFQLVTKEYHAIPVEKLPRFQLYIELHNEITRALLHRNNSEIDRLFDHISSGKFDDEVHLIHELYSIKTQNGKLYGFYGV